MADAIIKEEVSAEPETSAARRAAVRMMEVMPSMFRQIKNEVRSATTAGPVSMDDTQFMVIHALSHQEFTMSDLAERLMVSTPTISRMVETLVKDGFVERRSDTQDRRRVWLRLSQTGRVLVGEMEDRFLQVATRFLGRLEDEQLAQIVTTCDALATLLPRDNIWGNKKFCPQENGE